MRITTALATAALALGAVLGAAPAASADDTPGCVSLDEFRAVKKGMTKDRVHRIFGTAGVLWSRSYGTTVREYVPCYGDPEWSEIQVSFRRSNGALRMIDKYESVYY